MCVKCDVSTVIELLAEMAAKYPDSIFTLAGFIPETNGPNTSSLVVSTVTQNTTDKARSDAWNEGIKQAATHAARAPATEPARAEAHVHRCFSTDPSLN